MIPVELYKKATKDYTLDHVTPLNTQLTAYGSAKLPVVGQVCIPVWRDDYKCKLNCNLVENNAIRPLLGRKAGIGKYIDSYEINKPLEAIFTKALNSAPKLFQQMLLRLQK